MCRQTLQQLINTEEFQKQVYAQTKTGFLLDLLNMMKEGKTVMRVPISSKSTDFKEYSIGLEKYGETKI